MSTNARPAGRFKRTLPPGFKIRRRRFRSFAESLASGSRSGPLAADYDLTRRAGEAIMPIVRAYRLSIDFSSGGRCRIENGSTLVLNAFNAAQHNRLANLKTKLLGAIVAKGLPIYDLEIRVRPPKALPPASEPPKPAERLRSVTGARALRDEAARTADPEMRASLLALAEAVAPNAEERPGALLRGYRLELERAKAGAAAAAALEPALPSAPAESLIPSAADAAANPILEALRQKMLEKRARRARLETPLVAAAAALERDAEEAGGILGAYFDAPPEAKAEPEAAPAESGAAGQAGEEGTSLALAGAGQAKDALPPLTESELAALEEGLVSLHRRVTAALARMAEAARTIRADESEAARKAQADREAEAAAANAPNAEEAASAESTASADAADAEGSAATTAERSAAEAAAMLVAAQARLAEAEAAVGGAREALLPLLAESQRATDEASARLAPEDGAPVSERSLERFATLADAAAALRTTVRRRLDDADGLRRLLAEQKERLASLRALAAQNAQGAEAPDVAQRNSAPLLSALAAVLRAASTLVQQSAQLAEEAETLADQLAVMEARLASAVEAAEGTADVDAAARSEPGGEAADARREDASPEETAEEAARGERLAAEIERFKRAAALIPPGVDPKLIPDERDAAQDPERFALRLRLLARFDAHRHLDDLAAAASSLLHAADTSRAAGFGIDPAMLDEAARATDALEEALAQAAEKLHPAQTQPTAEAAGPEGQPAAASSVAPAVSTQEGAMRLDAESLAALEGINAEALGARLLEASKRLAALAPKLPRAPDTKLVPPEADCRRGAHGRRLAETRARMLERIERRRAFERAIEALQGRTKALRDRLSGGEPAAALAGEADSLLQDLVALESALAALSASSSSSSSGSSPAAP